MNYVIKGNCVSLYNRFSKESKEYLHKYFFNEMNEIESI